MSIELIAAFTLVEAATKAIGSWARRAARAATRSGRRDGRDLVHFARSRTDDSRGAPCRCPRAMSAAVAVARLIDCCSARGERRDVGQAVQIPIEVRHAAVRGNLGPCPVGCVDRRAIERRERQLVPIRSKQSMRQIGASRSDADSTAVVDRRHSRPASGCSSTRRTSHLPGVRD